MKMENKKKAFIHISDLHIVTDEITPGKQNKRYDCSWLQVSKNEQNSNFIDCFCDAIKSKFPEHDYYLIVSGDIADRAHEKEYDCAISLFKNIKEILKPKEILLVPGNHDIDRDSCKNAANLNTTPAHLLAEKYNTFSAFYKKFFNVDFNHLSSIVNKFVVDDEQLLFIGMNSNYKLDYEDGYGAFNMPDLKESFEKITEKYPNYSKIVVFHHNLRNKYVQDSGHWGTFEQNDHVNIIQFLQKNSVVGALYGNEHTENNHIDDGLFISDAGRFATTEKNSSTFKVYELIQDSGKVDFDIYKFILIGEGNISNHEWGEWNIIGDKQSITLRNSTNIPLNDANINTPKPIDSMPSNIKSNAVNDNPKEKNDEELSFQNYLVNIIKRKKIFHQGHFHWGENSRSLNWIDLTSIFKDREATKSIQAELVKFIEKEQIKYEAVIGIGMDGNILAAPFITKEVPYSYLPYSYRYDKSHEVEQNPNLDKNVNEVLLITDVVHSGNSISKLIKSKANKYIDSSISILHVVSLLYTGNRKDLVFSEDERIKFHPMAAIEIAQCPYKDVSQCPICKNEFCDIFELDPKDGENSSK